MPLLSAVVLVCHNCWKLLQTMLPRSSVQVWLQADSGAQLLPNVSVWSHTVWMPLLTLTRGGAILLLPAGLAGTSPSQPRSWQCLHSSATLRWSWLAALPRQCSTLDPGPGWQPLFVITVIAVPAALSCQLSCSRSPAKELRCRKGSPLFMVQVQEVGGNMSLHLSADIK